MRKPNFKISLTMTFTIVAIILVIAGIILLFLVKGIFKKEAPHMPSVPPIPSKLLEKELIIKGCLFELGVYNELITICGHTFKIESRKKYSVDQISSAFRPLTKYGNVEVRDTGHVTIMIDNEKWEIEFIYPEKGLAAIIPSKPRIPAFSEVRMAIIVDDMGPDMKAAELLASIDGDLTFSVMPMRPHSQEVARYLHENGHEVMLHLPMQGAAGHDPGEGAIYKGMAPDQIQTILLEDIKAVPYISGVNNHMGSEVTQDREIMVLVENELRNKGLFFIDSLTTGKSVGFKIAQEIGLPWNKRDVFLDNEQNETYIMGQLEQLKNLAKKRSSAIGICHPHPETIAVLQREVPRLKAEGIILERVSKLVCK
jgi:hypothetical protein